MKGGSNSELLSEKGAAHLLSVTAFSGNSKRSGIRTMRYLENNGATVKCAADREKVNLKELFVLYRMIFVFRLFMIST